MIDFDDPRVTFKVKGALYYLLPLSFDDVPAVGGALQVDTLQTQADLLVDVLTRKARCDRPSWWLRLTRKPTPADAVRALSVRQQAHLFGEWLGDLRDVVPGESNGSAN